MSQVTMSTVNAVTQSVIRSVDPSKPSRGAMWRLWLLIGFARAQVYKFEKEAVPESKSLNLGSHTLRLVAFWSD